MSLDTLPAAETTPEGTAPVPASAETGPVSAPDDSLASHEEAHSPEARVERDRDEEGRFASAPKPPRRRAASQQADADDVPTINALTARRKAVEEQHGKDIARKPNESDRVYNLRRHTEMLERAYTAPKAPPAAPTPLQQPSRPVQQLSPTFPAYEAFIGIEGNEDKTYDDYTDARAEWRYGVIRQTERQREAAEKAQRDHSERISAHLSRVEAAKQKYSDWDTAVPNVPVGHPQFMAITPVIEEAILASNVGADIQYYLATHRDILSALYDETQDYSKSAVHTTRRYLDTLVAEQRSPSPSTRTAAGTTGSALALAPPPAPRPPNPVRTGAEAPPDTPPDDSSDSLSAHEQFFHRRRR